MNCWPKLFHNLRTRRQTELTARFPLHVVCGWIDNSAPIADKHYLQITDDHYADAVTIATPKVRGTESGTVNVKSGTKAAQNPAQQPAATGGTNSQETKIARQNRAILLPDAFTCDALPGNPVPPRGVEQSHYSPGKMPIEDASGTVCGTVGAQNSLLDTWLHACPVELDDRRQEIIRQIAQWAAQ